MADSEKNKPKSRAAFYTILIICVLAIGGILGFFFARSNIARSAPNYVRYPTISSSLASSKDGKSHTVDVDFTVQFKDGTEGGVSKSAVVSKMTEAVSGVDYEDLKGENGITHLENTVKESLKDVTDPENITDVYVGNIAIDFPGVVDTQSGTPNNNDARLKGLFKNIK